MAKRFLMEHPVKGRMFVSEDKLDEYLEAGFVEIEQAEQETEEAKPTHQKAIENIEAKSEEPAKKTSAASSKKSSKKK